MQKDFRIWHELKSKLDVKPAKVLFKEREIWWCAIGKNVGVEANGKSQLFSRPVVVFKKLTQNSFYGIPLTTANKTGSWYVVLRQQGIESRAMLSQIRLYDSKRLFSRLGTLDDTDWKRLKQAFQEFFQ